MSVDQLMRSGGAEEPEPPDARRRRRLRTLAYVLLAVLVVVALLAAAAVLVASHLGNQVGRYPGVFAGLDTAQRPAGGAGQTFLLVGTDTRSPEATTGRDAAPDAVFGSQRSDVIMLATIAPDGRSASVVSLPRDSWVDIPGHGRNKINAAYAFGGPSLLIQTVEQVSRVRVDHFAVIDFAGFQQMTDAAGGIDVTVPQATSDMRGSFPAGPQHLDGAQALTYVRQRYNLPGGDFDRVKREQNALRALVRSALSSGTLSDPRRAYGLVDTVTQHVGVDDSLSDTALAGLVLGLRDLREENIAFVTAPTRGTGTEGSQSVVYLDPPADAGLFDAVNRGTVGSWADEHDDLRLPDAPR